MNVDIDYFCLEKTVRGFTFFDEKSIQQNFRFDILIEVTLPMSEPNFRMTKHKNYYRANMIILGKRRLLSDLKTIDYLSSIVDIDAYNILLWANNHGYSFLR